MLFGYELKEMIARHIQKASQNSLELTFTNKQVLRLVTDQAVDIMLLIRQHMHLIGIISQPDPLTSL